MKLKLVILLVCLMASSSFAATIGNWNDVDGLWSVGTNWLTGTVPVVTTNGGDEIKIEKAGRTTTIDDSAVIDYIQRLSIQGGTNHCTAPKVVIQEGVDPEFFPTAFGMGEFRVGALSNANARTGRLEMTGGTLTVNDMILGRNKNATYGVSSMGWVTISGGTLQARSTANGRLQIGAYAESAGMGSYGEFTVVGSAASINMKKLYVGGNSRTEVPGTGSVGILRFILDEEGVSRIVVDNTQIDAVNTADATTHLIVKYAECDPGLDVIVLVQNTGDTAVVRQFDKFNYATAMEGRARMVGGVWYKLTYKYNAEANGGLGEEGTGNDIALIIPEPATLVLLGLGLVALRRNKK